jgi:hypothetical protein
MQGGNLCLSQNFILSFNEQPRQHFDDCIFHVFPCSRLRHV